MTACYTGTWWKKSYSSIWWCWHRQRYVYILSLTKFLNFIGICGLLQFAKNLTYQNAKHLNPLKRFIGIWDFDRNTQLSRLLQQELLWYWKLVLRICKIQSIKLWEKKPHMLAISVENISFSFKKGNFYRFADSDWLSYADTLLNVESWILLYFHHWSFLLNINSCWVDSVWVLLDQWSDLQCNISSSYPCKCHMLLLVLWLGILFTLNSCQP